MLILDAVEAGPCTLSELVERSGINRATAHRLATALEVHGMLRRSDDGKFTLGYRLWALGNAVPGASDLVERVQPLLSQLRDTTGESAQLYVREGDDRVCLAAAESAHGLRTIVPVGARLTLERGSAGAIFRGHIPADPQPWVQSVAEREPGVASVSSPILNAAGSLIAVVSVSGPIERTTTEPGHRYGSDVAHVASRLAAVMS